MKSDADPTEFFHYAYDELLLKALSAKSRRLLTVYVFETGGHEGDLFQRP